VGITQYQKTQELAGGVIEMPEEKKEAKATGMSLGVPELGGDFELVNQDGETVTQENYADQYKLIFFGFTYCPAVCPTELGRMAKIMEGLGELEDKVQPMLISIDPERDTPEIIKAYVEQYHPKLVGLTGSQEQIDAVKDSFKVYASKVENEMMDEYMMDHSSFMYFMSPENNLIKLYSTKDKVGTMTEEIKAILQNES